MSNSVTIMLGSNTGNRKEMLDRAVDALRNHVTVTAASDDIDNPDYTGRGGDYLNRVVTAGTELSPSELSVIMKEIEHSLGRDRSLQGIVAIDIDLVTYNNTVIKPDEYHSSPYRTALNHQP